MLMFTVNCLQKANKPERSIIIIARASCQGGPVIPTAKPNPDLRQIIGYLPILIIAQHLAPSLTWGEMTRRHKLMNNERGRAIL